jgi:hypothetical protein
VEFVLLILVSPPVFGGVRVAHLGFTTSVGGIRVARATQIPPNTGDETKVSNMDPTKQFGEIRVAHLGFTTIVWWGLCCSS